MRMMRVEDARRFAELWLPAWTGNEPERLASFYTDDLFYSDPAIPHGVRGKDSFVQYLTKLLGENPNWLWAQESALPMEGGFLNKWRARIPVGDRQVVCRGVCTVEMRGNLIERNEVYFDRLELVAAIRERDHARKAQERSYDPFLFGPFP